MSTKNIVLFGQSGAGKSSVLNLMAGKENLAKTSPDMARCTGEWTVYPISFGGQSYNVYDTIGLQEHQLGVEEYLDAIVNARSLVTKLQDEGGIDLLLFCMKAGRFTSAIQHIYWIFYEWLCKKNVPISLIVTGLEDEQNMDNWWTRCHHSMDRRGIVVGGHACITAIEGWDKRHQQLYKESYRLVWSLVIQQSAPRQDAAHKEGGGCKEGNERAENDEGGEGDGWLWRLLSILQEFFQADSLAQKKRFVNSLVKRGGMPRETAEWFATQIFVSA